MEMPTLTLSDTIRIIKRRRWYIILPFAAFFLSLTVVSLTLPPVYESTSTILIEQQDIPAEFVRATVSTYAEQQLQIINQRIMSSTRLLEIINRFNLYQDLRDREPMEDIIGKMREDIKLEPISVELVDPKTGRPTTVTIAFTLSYEGKNDPQKVYQVSNVLTSLFLEENVQARERQAGEVSKFLETELAKVKEDLTRMDGAIARFKEEHINDLPELMPVNMQSVRDTERNIDMLMNQISQLKEKEGYLVTQLAGIPSDFKESDRLRLNELKVQLVNLRQTFSEEHPDVRRAKAEISELERSISASGDGGAGTSRPDNPAYITLASQLSSVRCEIGSMSTQIADLRKRLFVYKHSIGISPKVEAQYNSMQMERSNIQAKYDDLMRKVMEAKVSHGLEKEQKGERFTIIDPARPPEKPSRPNRVAIMLIGLVLGIGAGAGTAAVKEYSDTSVRSADFLSQALSFPVLAVIPEILPEKDIIRSKKQWSILMIGIFATLMAGIAVFHFVVMDVDIFWARFIRWMGL